MKQKKVILIIITIFFVLYKLFFSHAIDYSEYDVYTNKNYILSVSEKQILMSRLKNDIFFDKYHEEIEEYVEISINKDKKDKKAWGLVSLIIDKNLENEIEEILLKTNESISTDSRTYGIIDEYGSIYIEKSYLYDQSEKIKLVFSVNLPYKYNLKEEYNKQIEFFLKFNN